MPKPSLDFITIGAATVDIFAGSKDIKIIPDPTSATGKSLTLPTSYKTEMSHYKITSGGGATNAAVSLSRLGLKTACLSQVGNEDFSYIITSELQKDKVDITYLTKKSEHTDFSVILNDPEGGRTVLVNRGEIHLEDQDIPWEKLSSSWFYITSLSGNISLLEKLIGHARDKKIKIALNPGTRELKVKDTLKPLLKYLDFLLLNSQEAEILTGLDFGDSTFWREIESYGSKVIAVTNGRNGAYLVGNNQSYFAPILNFAPVDENGAGDAFGSATCAALSLGKSLQESLAWGLNNSASVVSYYGCKPGLLTRSQIESRVI